MSTNLRIALIEGALSEDLVYILLKLGVYAWGLKMIDETLKKCIRMKPTLYR